MAGVGVVVEASVQRANVAKNQENIKILQDTRTIKTVTFMVIILSTLIFVYNIGIFKFSNTIITILKEHNI